MDPPVATLPAEMAGRINRILMFCQAMYLSNITAGEPHNGDHSDHNPVERTRGFIY
jgi:hypothetical protein